MKLERKTTFNLRAQPTPDTRTMYDFLKKHLKLQNYTIYIAHYEASIVKKTETWIIQESVITCQLFKLLKTQPAGVDGSR